MLPRYPVLNTVISTGPPAEFVAAILELGAARTGAYVCFANVHMLMEAERAPAFGQVLAGAALVAPDGGPVATALGWLHGRPQARVAGMDLLPELLAAAAARGQSVYFYGTSADVLAAMVARARRELPALRIVGAVAPPFRPLTAAEEAADVAAINAADPDLLFVALGCPRQERWMAARAPGGTEAGPAGAGGAGTVRACMLGVGQAFRVYAGLERRLPPWARRLWLEWAYRLWQEPRRLGPRYLQTNTRFLWRLGQALLRRPGAGRTGPVATSPRAQVRA